MVLLCVCISIHCASPSTLLHSLTDSDSDWLILVLFRESLCFPCHVKALLFCARMRHGAIAALVCDASLCLANHILYSICPVVLSLSLSRLPSFLIRFCLSAYLPSTFFISQGSSSQAHPFLSACFVRSISACSAVLCFYT